MTMLSRPFRSVLYLPGSNERALEKAQNLAVDALIFDLEDAVAPDAKVNARTTLVEKLSQGDFGARYKIVRVNGLDTAWGAADLDVFATVGPDAILVPKVESRAALNEIATQLDQVPAAKSTKLWAMMETPKGILNAAEIAQSNRLEGFVMGTNDLAKDLGSRTREAMMTSLQHCLLAARAEGLICIDGVFNAFKDEEGLRIEAEQGRDLGFDGKSLIHPAQLVITNEVFAPSAQEVELAQRQIDAFNEATAEGKGVAVVDGKIVENLHVATAKTLLAKAGAIAKMEG